MCNYKFKRNHLAFIDRSDLVLMQLYFLFIEEATGHFLRLTNRYCGGVCHPSCEGGEAEIWPHFPCL